MCKADGQPIGEVSKNARSLSIVAMNSSRMRLLSFQYETGTGLVLVPTISVLPSC